MYLSAVIAPPAEQREEVVRLLTEVGARMDAPAPAPAARTRWGRSKAPAAPAAPTGGPTLVPLPLGSVVLPLTRFGYVEPEAGARLRAALELDARAWPTPTVHVTGELSTHGTDQRLHLALGGDTDGLRSIFRGMTDASKRAGFMQDRRTFAPLVPVADLDEGVSDEALGTLVAGLEGFAGTPWRVDTVILARLGFAGDEALHEVATIPLGAGGG